MVYLLRVCVRAAGVSASYCNMVGVEPGMGWGGGGEACSPSPSTLTPYTLLDTQAQQYGGGGAQGGGKAGGGSDLCVWSSG